VRCVSAISMCASEVYLRSSVLLLLLCIVMCVSYARALCCWVRVVQLDVLLCCCRVRACGSRGDILLPEIKHQRVLIELGGCVLYSCMRLVCVCVRCMVATVCNTCHI